ncbi:MAG: VOC family protein [Comamonadaceae bacterium]|nr:MAG: VOC family protein [Comamonadaceae bacterium]
MTSPAITHHSACQIDHLVVAAASLAEGVAWCEETLGLTPGPGGEHALMGTHNRLLRCASPRFASAYLEVIAIRPGASCQRPHGAKRWFDLDDPEMQARLARQGPQLVHVVARTANAQAAVRALTAIGLARGPLIEASRPTPAGLLSWQISVRDDGQRLFYGALPTLIQWGGVHPADSMDDAGLALLSLAVSHPRPQALVAAYEAIGLQQVAVSGGPPNLIATLQTPRGLVTLESSGI